MHTFCLIPFLLLMHFSATARPSSGNNSASKTETITVNEPVKSKGYWVIQQPAGVSDKVLVCYYNDRNELVKKEWRALEEVNISKPRVARSFKKAFQEAIKLQAEENWN